jgi:hypothetical protein
MQRFRVENNTTLLTYHTHTVHTPTRLSQLISSLPLSTYTYTLSLPPTYLPIYSTMSSTKRKSIDDLLDITENDTNDVKLQTPAAKRKCTDTESSQEEESRMKKALESDDDDNDDASVKSADLVMESDTVSGSSDDEKTTNKSEEEEEEEEPCTIDKYWDLPSLSGYFGDIDPTTAKLQRLVRSPVDNPSANSLNFRPIVVYGENGEYSSVVTSAGAITFGCDLIDGTYVPMGHETSLEFPKSDAKDASIFITPTFEEDAMFTKWMNTATSSIVESAVEPTIHPAFANIAESVKKSDKCKGLSDDEATDI